MWNSRIFFISGLLLLLLIGYFSFRGNFIGDKTQDAPKNVISPFSGKIRPEKIATSAAEESPSFPSLEGDFPGISLKVTPSFDGSFSRIQAKSMGSFHKNQLDNEIEKFLKAHSSLLRGYPDLKIGNLKKGETPFFHIVEFSFRWNDLPYPGAFKFFFNKGSTLQLEEIQNTMPILDKFNDCEDHTRDEIPEIMRNIFGSENIRIDKISEKKIISSSAKTAIIGVDVFYKTSKGNFLASISLCNGELLALPQLLDIQ